jgi:hypothetical protein
MVLVITRYQIRAGSPQPVSPSCPSSVPTSYVYQTFGAQKVDVDVYESLTELKKSSDMQGQKPTENVEDPTYRANTYTRISYTGRPLRTTDGEQVFSGQEEHVEEFVDEDLVPGWS